MKDVKNQKSQSIFGTVCGGVPQKVVDVVCDILKHYSCSPDCHAYCCKKLYCVTVDAQEYKTLREIAPDTVGNFKTVRQGRINSYELSMPCAYLGEAELCTVYNSRPKPCRLYPFSYVPKSKSRCGEYGVKINPCIMGVKIYYDLHKFVINEIEKNNCENTRRQVSLMEQFLENLDKDSALLYSDGSKLISTPILNIEDAFEFLEYLNESK